jgi:NAD(P)-dependent dehydrogenase (short-subunit alcohol dehydrogenase family)
LCAVPGEATPIGYWHVRTADTRRVRRSGCPITGAASGIDAAVAIRLASKGAHVAVADIDDLGAERTVHLIREAGGHAEAVAVDVSDPASVETAVAKTVASFGALHLAVNNAGVTGAARAHRTIRSTGLAAGDRC